MRVDIFCESGSAWGLGHFYRCLKLALLCARLPQIRAITLHNRGDFSPDLPALLAHDSPESSAKIAYIAHEWLENLHSPNNEPNNELESSSKPRKPLEPLEIAIIDSYEASSSIYAALARESKALICLDDTLRDIYPPHSIILNPLPESKEHFSQARFAGRKYRLWCGEEYMILPPAINFVDLANVADFPSECALDPLKHGQKALKSPESSGLDSPMDSLIDSSHACSGNSSATSHITTRHIFVSFGGVDRENYTQAFVDILSQILGNSGEKAKHNTCHNTNAPESSALVLHSSALDSARAWHFHLVLGGGYGHILDTSTLPAGSFSVHRDLSQAKFLALARSCACAISAGGGSMLELLALQVPSIILETAENQRAQIAHWAARGAIIHATDLESALAHLPALLAKKSLSAMRATLSSLRLGSALVQALENLTRQNP